MPAEPLPISDEEEQVSQRGQQPSSRGPVRSEGDVARERDVDMPKQRARFAKAGGVSLPEPQETIRELEQSAKTTGDVEDLAREAVKDAPGEKKPAAPSQPSPREGTGDATGGEEQKEETLETKEAPATQEPAREPTQQPASDVVAEPPRAQGGVGEKEGENGESETEDVAREEGEGGAAKMEAADDPNDQEPQQAQGADDAEEICPNCGEHFKKDLAICPNCSRALPDAGPGGAEAAADTLVKDIDTAPTNVADATTDAQKSLDWLEQKYPGITDRARSRYDRNSAQARGSAHERANGGPEPQFLGGDPATAAKGVDAPPTSQSAASDDPTAKGDGGAQEGAKTSDGEAADPKSAASTGGGTMKPPGGLDAGAATQGGGDPIKGLMNEENVNKLAKASNLTPEETKALHDTAKIAKGIVAGAEMYEGKETPDNVKDVVKAVKPAKEFIQKNEAATLKKIAPKLGKKAEEGAKKIIKQAFWSTLTMILIAILIVFLLFLIIIVVILFAIGGSGSDEQGAGDQTSGNAPQAIVQYGAPAGVTQGFMQADPSQLVGLTPELLIVLNRCGDIAPIIVTMGAGGPPGTSRYDGRSVGLSTKAVPRDDVKALETCLAKAATPCTEDLLGPEPSLCISSAKQPSCEAQRVAQVAATQGDILLSLTRACVPLEQRPPSSTPPVRSSGPMSSPSQVE